MAKCRDIKIIKRKKVSVRTRHNTKVSHVIRRHLVGWSFPTLYHPFENQHTLFISHFIHTSSIHIFSLSKKMRTLCPNLDNEDGLETVLEVPMPDESLDHEDVKISQNITSWKTMKSWMKPHSNDQRKQFSDFGGQSAEIQLLLGVVGAPLVPLPISSRHSTITKPTIQDHPIVSPISNYHFILKLWFCILLSKQ